MKATPQEVYDSFKVGYEAYEASRIEANEVWDLYHNRQYTQEQLNILANRGQPAETFNVIKMFARMLIGYYSSIVNTPVVIPNNPRDVDTAGALNDVMTHVLKENRFDTEGDKLKLGGLVSGLMCCYEDVQPTDQKDRFGRTINKVKLHYVPDSEIVLDPMSRADDYSDARYLHRFKWMTKDAVIKQFGKKALKHLTEYYNHLNINEADFEFNYGDPYSGYFKVFENYLIVDTVMEDENGDRWRIFWHDKHFISKKKITTKKARWPYRVQRLHDSDHTEYYGIFREAIQAQRALNQAVLKIQLMVNSEKAFVEKGAVEDIDEFTTAFNRVNAVIEVQSLSGVKIENLTQEVADQYVIIDRALDRLQRVLGINDSFLGMAFASDSGRKVKLQQQATIMSLRYVTARIESFYQLLGWDVASLIEQYYTANQVLQVADEVTGQRWIEINRPMTQIVGIDEMGQYIYEPILLPQTDPANGDFVLDEEGNIILAPVNEPDTDFTDLGFQVEIEASSYNDEDERSQLLLETVMSGQIGQMLSQVNPSGRTLMG